MQMYAIIDKYNEGFYYNFEKQDFDMIFSEKCLLPTFEMTKEFIEDQLCTDNDVITVEIDSYRNGSMGYSTDENKFFDNDYDGDDEDE